MTGIVKEEDMHLIILQSITCDLVCICILDTARSFGLVGIIFKMIGFCRNIFRMMREQQKVKPQVSLKDSYIFRCC